MERHSKKSVWINPKFAKLIGRDVPDDGWVEPAAQSSEARDEPPDLHIPALGPLHRDLHIPEWLVSEPLPIPFFDGQKVPVTIEKLKESDQKEIEDAVSSFLRLGRVDRLAISGYVFANYQQTAELVSEEDLGCHIESEQAVWDHVQPGEIYISRRHRRDCAIYLVIGASCDWEPEHGLQMVYRRGSELVRVSQQDGHLTHTDAYDLPEEQDRIVD
jgi:hypothetical protein